MAYNGWTNYETWAVKLWIDTDHGSYNIWRETTRECWDGAADKSPNEFMTRSENARLMLAEHLKEVHEEGAHDALTGASVYSDLLSAALSEVNWLEIANAMLEDGEFAGYEASK